MLDFGSFIKFFFVASFTYTPILIVVVVMSAAIHAIHLILLIIYESFAINHHLLTISYSLAIYSSIEQQQQL